jgi:hypothetical protein
MSGRKLDFVRRLRLLFSFSSSINPNFEDEDDFERPAFLFRFLASSRAAQNLRDARLFEQHLRSGIFRFARKTVFSSRGMFFAMGHFSCGRHRPAGPRSRTKTTAERERALYESTVNLIWNCRGSMFEREQSFSAR